MILQNIPGQSNIKSGAYLLILFSFLLSPWANPAFASLDKPPGETQSLTPASLILWPEGASDYAILVDKSEQKVLIYRWDDLSKHVKAYEASTGENGGKKSRKNDKKTPEGIYFFTHSFPEREPAPRYGSRAFPIDYPNPMDKRKGRGGYCIWFHGLDKPLKPRDTKGCIALENRNIDDLASYIRLNDTPVIISSNIEMVEAEILEKQKKALLNTIENWRMAWERKEVDRYMSFYSPRFKSDEKTGNSGRNIRPGWPENTTGSTWKFII